MSNAARISSVRSNAAYRPSIVADSSEARSRPRFGMLNAVLDRLASVLRPAGNTSGVPRLAAIGVLAALGWGLLAIVGLAAAWVVQSLPGA